MEKYKVGDIVKAKIVAIEKYGAFAALDDEYSGLIHVSELSENYVRNASDYVEIGEIINVKILENNGKPNQLKLSSKNVNDDLYKLNNRKIKETVFGFYLLKSALPKWIDQKMEEINKKNKNTLDN